MILRRFTALLAAILLSGCAQTSESSATRTRLPLLTFSKVREAFSLTRLSAPPIPCALREARSKRIATETRAALYLKAAAETSPKSGQWSRVTCDTHNAATAELSVLLRTAEGGRLWNHPLTLSAGGSTYRLRLQPGNKQGVWAPDFFTSFVPAKNVTLKSIKHPNREQGIGGVLVGIRKKTPREQFAPYSGITAPVTATLDFQGTDVTLALRDPGIQPKARVDGAVRELAADFSAPLAYYPYANETITGLMGALRVSRYMDLTGLYLLQPYDPNRIPLIFVHGLISTPQMWRNVINEIEADPVLRGRFQFWVFAYPTGNPAAYSALRLREELAKAKQRYGFPRGFVLVGHSMGGIISRMQGTTVTGADWNRINNIPTQRALMNVASKSGIIRDSLLFNANPDLRRIVFICTPHRGSYLAIEGIGQLAMRLITLPATLVDTVQKSAGDALTLLAGKGRQLPNSVTSLSPKSPMLKVVDQVPLRAPHHTILGNRGKKSDITKSSDGVVPYWSSHLESAKSEKVVPGPHSSCELPQTIEELRRILHLHLKSQAR